MGTKTESTPAPAPVDAAAELLRRVGVLEQLLDRDIKRLKTLAAQASEEAELASRQASQDAEPFGLDRIASAVADAKLVLERIRVRREAIKLLKGAP